MKTYKLNMILIAPLFLILCLVVISSAYAYSCQAHIYNNSNKPWIFFNHARTGNVHFGDNCPVNGPCKITAGTTQTIIYTQTRGAARGTMDVVDYKNVAKSFEFYGNNECPVIYAGPYTNAVKRNLPKDGDFTIRADAWDEGISK